VADCDLREKKPFASYEDFQKRTGLSDVKKILSKRVMES